MDSRMKSPLAVAAVANAARRRQAGRQLPCALGSTSPSSAPRRFVKSLRHHGSPGPMGEVGARADNAGWNRSSRCCESTFWTVSGGSKGGNCAWPSRPGSSGRIPPPTSAKTAGRLTPTQDEQSTGPRSQRLSTLDRIEQALVKDCSVTHSVGLVFKTATYHSRRITHNY